MAKKSDRRSSSSPLSSDTFWLLRSIRRLHEARIEFERIAAAREREGLSGVSDAELALMRNSLTRAERGGREAEKEFLELEQTGAVTPAAGFQFHYQASMNAYAQGAYSLALERLLRAQTPLSDDARPDDLLIFHSTKLLCFLMLGFPLNAAMDEALKALDENRARVDFRLLAAVEASIEIAILRAKFRSGGAQEIMRGFGRGGWSQAKYFRSWVAALPFVVVDRRPVEKAIYSLTTEIDFYMRSYRLQTLVGRAHVGSGSQAAWSDRADRLYLWTWRWLAEPSPRHEDALAAVLAEFETWDGLDNLAFDDLEQIRNSLEWILIFEPERRARWSKLLTRSASVLSQQESLYSLERLWIKKVGAAVAKGRTEEIESEIARHPLANAKDLAFSGICEKMIAGAAKADVRFRIDPEAGLIYQKGKVAVRSASLSSLLAALLSVEFAGAHQTRRLSFKDALFAAYGIGDFDPDIHTAKLQNLIVRIRRLIGRRGKVHTRDGWIFLDADARDFIVGREPSRRRRLKLSKSRSAAAPASPERRRNERSLSVLLRDASDLRDRDFSRQDLERQLGLPKPTLNRYLRAWLERGWVEKIGSGKRVSYRITFFES